MRILHITAQKPNGTGSGVYMSGLIDNLKKLGHKQCVIAGIDSNDSKKCFSDDIKFYPLVYNSENLPFKVLGMSDIMPYESTRYKDLNKHMINQLKIEFIKLLKKVIKEFNPDLIICNHLYLLTSFVREYINDIKVIGLCHGTCLRQLRNIDLEKSYIISNIRKLDDIFVLHENQKYDVMNIFEISKEKIFVIGSGYNNEVFLNKNYKKNCNIINIAFAGKICKSKGIKSLLLSLNTLNYDKESIILNIAGSGNDKEELIEIKEIAKKCKYKVNFLGKLEHSELSELFNKCHIFILPSFYEGLPIVVLEALACGCKVIVSNINGVKDWIGEKINNSGNISYVNLPSMKNPGVPIKKDLKKFEDELSITLDEYIKNIISEDDNNKNISLEDKTWKGVAKNVNEIIENLV